MCLCLCGSLYDRLVDILHLRERRSDGGERYTGHFLKALSHRVIGR